MYNGQIIDPKMRAKALKLVILANTSTLHIQTTEELLSKADKVYEWLNTPEKRNENKQ